MGLFDAMPLCNLCPRRCNADRGTPAGLKRALCKAGPTPRVALVSLHPWEEPCIAGKKGAGTVFFSHCHLRCVFCQNHAISTEGKGLDVTPERLTAIFLEQQARGASCLELVTPTHFTDAIVPALKKAKEQGLTIPVAYNTNGYELPQTLRRYEGLIDIFMPDLKYFDDAYATKYSAAPHYFTFASEAIKTMYAMVGAVQIGDDGLMTKGVLVRHLVLPWLYKDSFKCLTWLYDNFKENVYLSLMNQYMPLYKAAKHPEINRPLTTLEYDKVVKFALQLGYKKAFIQVGKTAVKDYIPIFNGSNVL